MKEFKILHAIGTHETVKGHQVKIKGLDIFIDSTPTIGGCIGTRDKWRATEMSSHARLCTAPTKIKVIALATKILNSKTKKEIQIAVYAKKHSLIRARIFNNPRTQKFFYKTFGVPISDFVNKLSRVVGEHSLDVMEFDKYLKTPDGISTCDFITKKYGEKAAKLVRALL